MKLSNEELGTLLLKARNGDSEAFSTLYLETYQIQYYLALKYTHNPSMAQDVVQELYTRLYTKMSFINKPEYLIAYMNKMNFNISATLLKQSNREVPTDFFDSHNEIVDTRSASDDNYNDESLLSKAIDYLDDELKEIVVLRYMQKMKIKDIAEIKQVSKKTIERKLKTSLSQLRSVCKQLQNSTLSFTLLPISISLYFMNVIPNRNVSNAMLHSILQNIYGYQPAINESVKKVSPLLVLGKIGSQFKRLPTTSFTSVILTGTILATISLSPPLYAVHYTKDNTNSFVECTIETFANSKVKSIVVYDEDGNQIAYEENTETIRFITYENGNYTVDVVGANGVSSTKILKITSIDTTYPNVSSFTYVNGVVTVNIIDDLSAIDLESISVISESGNTLDYVLTVNDSKIVTITYETVENSMLVVNDLSNHQIIAEIKIH